MRLNKEVIKMDKDNKVTDGLWKTERYDSEVVMIGASVGAQLFGDNSDTNAELIVAAVNACKEINPDNPLVVAHNIKAMYDALELAKLQTEYLQSKFQETGSGNQVIARIESVLSNIRD